MASCSGGCGDGGRDKEKIQKGVQEMLKYLKLEGNLNPQLSRDGAQAEGDLSRLSCELQPQVPATTILGDQMAQSL